MQRRILAGALLLFLAPTVAVAQKDAPPRPRLAAGADTNEASHYYDAGLQLLNRAPEKAVDMFFWASRLNPLSADNYYARRVAILLSDPRRLARYWQGDRATRKQKEIQQADSLYLYALTLNPFFYQKLDQLLFRSVVSEWAKEASGSRGNQLAVEYEIETYLSSLPASFRAWRAYGNGQFRLALDLYAQGIKSARNKAGLRTERGRLFVQLNQPDSAIVELTLALDEMKKRDKKDFVYFYDSKALMEHSIAMAQLRLGNTAQAKESFGRALEEDLSYYPAHIQLAMMALEARDTAGAASEVDLAVQLKPDNAGVRYLAGFVLKSLGQLDEAAEQARKAIELNDVFAASHLLLAEVLDAQKKPGEAVAAYREFIDRASGFDQRILDARERVKLLQRGVAGS